MKLYMKAGTVMGMAATMVLLIGGTANAAWSNPISGSCNGTPYTSTINREVYTANDYIEVYINTPVPSGFYWEIIDATPGSPTDGKPVSPYVHIAKTGTWYTLMTGVANHFQFVNRFYCSSSYTAFSGGEYY